MSSIAIEDGLKIAVLIPCHNQAATIEAVVSGFIAALPSAKLYVFDNNSTDDTARVATRAGARVYREAQEGKGNVIRRMFADVDADVYVLAEGDGSADPTDAPSLVNALITEHVDMVVGTRRGNRSAAERSFGTRAFEWLYDRFFGETATDILSGYRAFTRRFVRSFPAISAGFDVEIELSMHASQLKIPVAELALSDGERSAQQQPPPDDTLRMLKMSALLMKDARPFFFYGVFAVAFWALGLSLLLPFVLGTPAGATEPPFSDAALGMAMFVAGFILAACGLILDALGRSRIEQKRILFLTVPALGGQ